MNKLFFYMFFLFIFIRIFNAEEFSIIWNPENNFGNYLYKLDNVELNYSNKIPVYYSIKSTKNQTDDFTDLYLSFDDDNNVLMNNYSYIYKKYHISENKSIHNKSAYFIGDDERIELIGSNNTFFQSGVNLESFTISFWVYPASFSNNEIILRIGSQYYNKDLDKVEDQSINAKMIDGKIIWEFNNIFIDSNGSSKSFKIESYSRIIPEKWSQIDLSYDCYTGIIKEIINGHEEGIIVATKDGSFDSTILNMRFHLRNRCIIMIAPSFYGAIDEFYITKKIKSTQINRYAYNDSKILSKVIDFGKGGIYLENIIPNDITNNNSKIVYYYRYSLFPFDKDDQFSEDIKWNILTPNNDFSRKPVRFFQWKAVFYTGNEANYSPKFKNIMIKYKKNYPPSKPTGIKYILCNNKISLKWILNPEIDIKGYKIYYGNISGQYFGNDAKEGSSPIDIGLTNKFELTGLNKNLIYYIAITAYDDNDEHIHESDFSEEISGRPFGNCGTE